MISEDGERLSFEMGLTGDYIEEKRDEVIKISDKKGINLSKTKILSAFDMNYPLTATSDALLFPLMTVQRPILALNDVEKVILSGWDIVTLRNFRDKKLGIKEMNLIGEMGSVYEHNNEIHEVNQIDKEKMLKMKQTVFENCAEEEMKIAIQGNFSTRVSCIYFEADGPFTGNLRNYFLVRGTDVKTQDIYTSIRKKQNFEYKNGEIIFDPTLENVEEIDYVLSKIHTLNSVRLEKRNKKIHLYRDDEDKELSLNEMSKFARKIIPKEWEIDVNNDHSVDIIYRGDNFALDKEYTANLLAKKLFSDEEYVITHVGDKKADVLNGKNTIFFPCYGTEAHKYCKDNNILHVPVLHGGDYSLIISEIKKLYE